MGLVFFWEGGGGYSRADTTCTQLELKHSGLLVAGITIVGFLKINFWPDFNILVVYILCLAIPCEKYLARMKVVGQCFVRRQTEVARGEAETAILKCDL